MEIDSAGELREEAEAAERRLLHTLDALAVRRRRLTHTWRAARAALRTTRIALVIVGVIGIVTWAFSRPRSRRVVLARHHRA